jgi:dihydroflavonol-4-reductase
VSTANCFTNGSLEDPGNETRGFMPWLKASGYAYSKYLAQEEVMMNVKKHAFPAIIVNPTFMIGANDSKPSSGKLLLYGYNRRIVFYPTGGKNFVNVQYAADAICQALTKGELGEAYLLAGKNMTYKDFFMQITKQTGKRKILIPIPALILSLMGRFSDLLEKLFSLSLPLNTVNAKLLNLNNYYTNKKAVLGLDMKNTEIELAVSNAIDWFKQNGHLKYD